MSVEFRIKDFFYPLSVLRLRTFLKKSQWFSEEELEAYQLKRFKIIIGHARKNVPYYRNLLDGLKLGPKDFKSIEDIKRIPALDKETLRKNFKSLQAVNIRKFKPQLCRTSGTSGEPVEFYQDKPSNILEFCYYWRYWSWAGYRLGMPFAEFTLRHFLDKGMKDISDRSAITGRLMLNPAQLSHEKINDFVSAIKNHKALFLKGSPSSIFTFANLLKNKGCNNLCFRAVFTAGEILFPYQRKRIEDTFHCKIFDSYGHMERAVAICQCPLGRYHVNSDYGILEIEEDKKLSSTGTMAGRVIGTSLYNFAMPLIRYKIDDIVEVRADKSRCECGRGLPICENIIGRAQDIIVTPDGRMLSNVFILFDILEGALWAQIIQEDVSKLKIKIIKGDNFSANSEQEFLRRLKEMMGDKAQLEIEHPPQDILETLLTQKYKPVVSHVKRG